MNATSNRPALASLTPTMISRNLAIALSVVLLHGVAVWVLYSGLLTRAVEVFVPAVVLSELIEPPKPKEAAPPPPSPRPSPPRAAPAPATEVKKAIPKAPAAAAPLPKAIVDPTPAPNAPTGATNPQPAPMAAPPAPLAAAPVAAAPAAQAGSLAVQLPSSDADYLQNPLPPYPPISRRLNEQGTTVMRVFIGTDGQPQRAEISKSSGFARLDSAASATVMRWRYVAGKRGGVPEAMWVSVPIVWMLE
jgi:periplasmic protein TonB